MQAAFTLAKYSLRACTIRAFLCNKSAAWTMALYRFSCRCRRIAACAFTVTQIRSRYADSAWYDRTFLHITVAAQCTLSLRYLFHNLNTTAVARTFARYSLRACTIRAFLCNKSAAWTMALYRFSCRCRRIAACAFTVTQIRSRYADSAWYDRTFLHITVAAPRILWYCLCAILRRWVDCSETQSF